jgi:hypothetical protein
MVNVLKFNFIKNYIIKQMYYLFAGVSRESVESMEVEDKKDGVVLVLPVRKSIFDEQTEEEKPSTTNLWRPFRFDSSPFDSLMIRMQCKYSYKCFKFQCKL